MIGQTQANDMKKEVTEGRNEKSTYLIIKRSSVIYRLFIQVLVRYIHFEYFSSVCSLPVHFLDGDLTMDREVWFAAVHGVAKNRTRLSGLNWTELMCRRILFLWNLIYQYFILWIVLSLFPLRNFCLCCRDNFLSFLLIVCNFYFYALFHTSFELISVYGMR